MSSRRAGQLLFGECACDGEAACRCVVVDSSLPSVVLSTMGAVLLIGLSAFWLASGAPSWVFGLLVLGVVLLIVVLFDLPVSAVFNEDGVTRRTPLRDQNLGWSKIDALVLTEARTRPGLVARVGRRKYLLAERTGLTREQVDLLSKMRP